MYECVICQSVNHSSRLHCQNCGTIPSQYSCLGVPTKDSGLIYALIETVVAHGVIRTNQKHVSRINLKTVTADYYAD